MRHLIPTVLLAPALFACETLDSADVRTSGIHAQIEVTADGQGQTALRAELRAGGGASNTFLSLDEGDRLYAFAETVERDMRERGDPFDRLWYETAFPIDAADTEFRVELARAEHDDADESVVRLPAPFALETPQPYESFRLAEQTIPLSWSPATDDELRVRVKGDCIETYDRILAADAGRYLLHPGTLKPRSTWQGGECDLRVTLTRSRVGALDPGFNGGRIVARQSREVQVRVVR